MTLSGKIRWKRWIFVGAHRPDHPWGARWMYSDHLDGSYYRFTFKYLAFGIWVRWSKRLIIQGDGS